MKKTSLFILPPLMILIIAVLNTFLLNTAVFNGTYKFKTDEQTIIFEFKGSNYCLSENKDGNNSIIDKGKISIDNSDYTAKQLITFKPETGNPETGNSAEYKCKRLNVFAIEYKEQIFYNSSAITLQVLSLLTIVSGFVFVSVVYFRYSHKK